MLAVVVGAAAGAGLGASTARAFARAGYSVAVLARKQESIDSLSRDIEAAVPGSKVAAVACDVSSKASVANAFERLASAFPATPVNVLVYNVSSPFAVSSFLEADLDVIDSAWRVSCLGAALVSQTVLPSMIAAGKGTIIFTGATASLRGGAKMSTISMPKFALRSLAQSLAREFGPKNIHVSHVIIDGIIDGDRAKTYGVKPTEPDTFIHPDQIANEYVHLAQQHRSAWTHELDLRPFKETFS